MLVQDFLRKQSLEKLKEYYGIKYTQHEDGRVILNYDQIESAKHKTNPIVRECRGLVLDSNNNWNLVARAFTRFFNLGETDDDKNFDWSSCTGFDKEDGSLILIYLWKDSVHLNTRGSFGDGEVNSSGITWRELFSMACPKWQELNDRYTYCFELCSRYNKVVRDYAEPTTFLLSVFDGEKELTRGEMLSEDYMIDVNIISSIPFDSEKEVQDKIEQLEKDDPTFEGYVLRDRDNNRIKVKSSTYLSLHRLFNNGNIAHVKNLLPIILKGEIDEIITYFPEMKQRIDDVKTFIDECKTELENYWFCFHDEKNQKKFALAIKDCKLSSYLFTARKLETDPVDEMYKNPSVLLKLLQEKMDEEKRDGVSTM
jgi:T4 RnlA family RNA ligase